MLRTPSLSAKSLNDYGGTTTAKRLNAKSLIVRESSESVEAMRGEKSVGFYCFGSFLIVLSDSEVRFGKIGIKKFGEMIFDDFWPIPRHFKRSFVLTPASYLAPSNNYQPFVSSGNVKEMLSSS